MHSDIYWINEKIYSEKCLGIMARPRGNDWLSDEIKGLKLRDVNCLVSLLENSESYALGLSKEKEECINLGIEFISYQIEDVTVPTDESSFVDLVKQLSKKVLASEKVVIHCRMGIGRSSLLAASVLINLGLDKDSVFENISKSRGVRVPDTEEQIEWVNAISNKLK